MRHFKIGATWVVGFLVLVVILQNTDSVETRVLSWTFSAPRAVVLGSCLGLGFGLGYLASVYRRRKRRNDA